MTAQSIAALITAFAGLVTTLIAVVRYLSRRDKQIAASNVFRTVVDSLSSGTEVQRLGGAILLRRFFDPDTELGQGRTPYAGEALDVMAAILREVETGNFQKLLADGLGYAPSLKGADLQRTNLQKAYLGVKRQGHQRLDLSEADFYRADLSGASLKGALAARAEFYQARLHNTIFKKADLTGASFFEADLLGADFTGATLDGAAFSHARNLAPEILGQLDPGGNYAGPTPFPGAAKPTPPAANVFLSKPGMIGMAERSLVDQIVALLAREDLGAVTLERDEYPADGAIGEVRRVISGCGGAVIFGFRQLEVRDGQWRTEAAGQITDIALPSTWNHVETGMAAMAGMPILFVVEAGIVEGLFELGGVDHVVHYVDLARPDHGKLRDAVASWCRAVREAGH